MVRLGVGLGRHEAARAPRRSTAVSRRWPGSARSRRSATPTVRAVATSAVREAENHDEFLRRAQARGGHRGRGHLGGRGGPAHPPRRAAGPAGVRPAPAAVRHRRWQHRAAARRAGRGARRPEPEARRGAAHQPVLRRPDAAPVSGRRPAGASCSPRSARSIERWTATASRWRSARRARSSRSCGWWPAAAGEAPLAHLERGDGDSADPGGRRGPAASSRPEADGPRIELARSRREAGRHHPGRRPHPRRGVERFGIEQLTLSDYALREGVLLDTIAAHARRIAAPPPRRVAPRGRAPGRHLRRGPRRTPPTSPRSRSQLFDETAERSTGSTSGSPRLPRGRRPCWPTWGCRCRTPSTTSTATTSSGTPSGSSGSPTTRSRSSP